MQLTKTDFIQYLNCPKSLWLMKRDPEKYHKGEFSDFCKKLTRDGYLVEDYVRALFKVEESQPRVSFQKSFKTETGLIARADVWDVTNDGHTHLYEVKSSTRVKNDKQHSHLKDACFQVIAAELSGNSIDRVSIIHLNGDYKKNGTIDPKELLTICDVTDEVRSMQAATEQEIDTALSLLQQDEIDRSGCSCLQKSRGHHCDSFAYFNPDVTKPSIYSLPNLSEKKRLELLGDDLLNLNDLPDDFPLSPQQTAVLDAVKSRAPVIDIEAIQAFFDGLTYPLHFFDYETFSSAIPIIDGMSPHEHLVFQFSLHILDREGNLEHKEFLASEAQLPEELIKHMKKDFGKTGSVVSWHASFEKSRNKDMATLHPEHADFLNEINDRMVDLEELFKTAYVNAAFDGYTSIKKVLPVLCPELSYSDLEVQDGTAAMEAWSKMIDPDIGRKQHERIASELRKYCELDTYAMVEIYRFLKNMLQRK